jgi:methionine-rich copper-binding protein CopC
VKRNVAAAAVAAALAAPGAAFAHASLEHPHPGYRERVETSPAAALRNWEPRARDGKPLLSVDLAQPVGPDAPTEPAEPATPPNEGAPGHNP